MRRDYYLGAAGPAPAEWQNLQKQWQNLQNLHLQAKNYCRFRMTDGKPFKRYTDDIPPLGTEHHRLSPDSKDRGASATYAGRVLWVL